MSVNVKDMELKSYGIRYATEVSSDLEECIENVQRRGYSILDSGFDDTDIYQIRSAFDQIYERYLSEFGSEFLQSIDEHNTVRVPMKYKLDEMLKVAFNENLLGVVKRLIDGSFILNQQNLICNPSNEDYNQGAWHRDLPYQHFVSSSPLAINAIYCVDDFTINNGASYVLPFSNRIEAFASERYVVENQVQIEAKAGSFIVLDCMTYHRGGYNSSQKNRRAINQAFMIPFFKQQISIPNTVNCEHLDKELQALLGVRQSEPSSVESYLDSRKTKQLN